MTISARKSFDTNVASLAASLRPQVGADRLLLENLATQIGGRTATLKELTAWIAQKAGRFKLSTDEPIGRFEAIEMLCLGVQGKLALWTALQSAREPHSRIAPLDLDELIVRARDQHQQLESLRLKLAPTALQSDQA